MSSNLALLGVAFSFGLICIAFNKLKDVNLKQLFSKSSYWSNKELFATPESEKYEYLLNDENEAY